MGTEGLLSVLQSVSSAETNYFNIYVEGLDDQVFGAPQSELQDVVQNISSLLAKSTSRPLGLRLLNKFIDQCSADVFNRIGNLWTSLTLKACHSQETGESILAFEALGRIAAKSLHTPELTKSFATGQLSKVYESLITVPLSGAVPALRCVEICLRLYPSSSGPSRRNIEKFLSRFHDSLDADVTLYSGKCLHLLQQVSGGEVRSANHKSQWKIYQTQLAGSIHQIFDDMFANCNEIWDDNVVQEQLVMEKLVLSHEPVNRAAQLYIRFQNLVQYLISALKEPFPAEKPILPKMLLGIVNRGLSVTCNLLHQNPITDNIALALLLPKVHLDLLRLLDVITSTLRGHILPHYNLILGLLMDAMKSTFTEDNNRTQKPFGLLRAKIYDSISLWCKIHNNGSRCEVIAEHLITEILSDVTPEQSELTLQVCAGAGKHMSKKMKRQIHKAQNERSKISQPSVRGGKSAKEPHKEDRNQLVCIAALRCLQEVLLSAASFIKPTKIKLLQTTLVQIGGNFYELSLDSDHLYSSAQCRLEIYNTLCVIVTTPHHLSPPPMDLILAILSNACSRDGTVKVRNHCARILQNLEKLIHPQKESLIFPVDGRDVRNAFIMLGQGRLLEDSIEMSLNNDETNVENDKLSQEDENEIENNLKTLADSDDDDVKLVEEDEKMDDKLVENEADEDVQLIVQEDDDDDNDCTFVSSEILETVKNDNNQLQEFPKSPEIVLHVDDDCESPTAAQPHEDGDLASDEPITKKPKLDEATKQQEENGEANGILINSCDEEDLNLDEDQLLEDIASAFVDDLA